jgi:hypothetical protein
MKLTYRVLAYLIAAGVLLQAAFIAFGVFGLVHDVDSGKVVDENYEGNAGGMLHALNGTFIIPLLALALLVISFFARLPDGRKWAGIVLGLVLLQVALAYTAFGAPIVGSLHGVNALALFAVALLAGCRAGRAAVTPPADESAAAPSAPRPAMRRWPQHDARTGAARSRNDDGCGGGGPRRHDALVLVRQPCFPTLAQ